MGAALEMTGLRFGNLFVKERAANKGNRVAWLCVCDCGVEKVVAGKELRLGRARSCGCSRGKAITAALLRHGHARNGNVSPTHRTWESMLRRCTDPNYSSYERYGAKGVTICERWNHFENFLEDMGERPNGKTLDRVDGALGYFKENCRWATATEQGRNRKGFVKLSMEVAREIRTLSTSGLSAPQIAKAIGVTDDVVRLVIKNKTWREDAA